MIKIVEFKNGKFAVRRWTLFGYEYLDNGLVRGWQNYWWPKDYQYQAYVNSEHEALQLRTDYYERKGKRRYDKGTPVS